VWEAVYKPFGEADVNPNSTVVNNFRFPGQYEDGETGLHYNYFRYYDPGSGRYLRADPLGLRMGVGLYSYVRNNPINFKDIYGLFESPWYLSWVPGQHQWDLFLTSLENDNYCEASINFGLWGVEYGIELYMYAEIMSVKLGKETGDIAVNLYKNTSKSITRFAEKAAARQAFSGEMRTAANRFFRGATSKSRDFKALDISNGAKRLEFFSPARNVGYGKRYVQEINSSGQVIREFKETIGPKGVIETKWIYGGP